jgi:tetratricopeptide (TPR) repeat protein
VATATSAQAPRESRDWKRIKTPDLVVVGNAEAGELRRAAQSIEEFRRTLQLVYPSMKWTSGVPTVLVVFKNDAAFARFRPRDERGKAREVSGYFSATPDVAYMVLAASSSTRQRAYQVLFHEYTHYVLHQNFPELPSWVDEGMAEFYSTFESDYRDGKALLGRAVDFRLRWLRDNPLLPLQQILTQEGAYKLFRDQRRIHTFYAESWALVHYLQLGQNGKRQGQLTAYLRALQSGRSVEDAFKEAFATTFDGLYRELYAYTTGLTFPAMLVAAGASSAANASPVENMLEADARYLQGDLLVRAGAPVEAEEELAKALTEDPEHADARIARALAWRQQGKRDDAIAELEAVAKARPASFRAHHELATALRSADRHADALVASRRALQQNERSAAAWFGISLSSLSLGRTADADVALGNTVKLDPDAHWYRSHAYEAYRLGHHDIVVKDAAAYLDRAGSETEDAPYVAFLAALSHRKLGRAEDAQKILEQAEGGVLPGSWTEQVMLFMRGQSSASQFMGKARSNGDQSEAHTYIGILLGIAGDRAGAVEHLRWVKQRGSRNYVEYPMAVAELEQLERSRQ